MESLVYKVFLLNALGVLYASAITTIHHDKPDLVTISTIMTSTPRADTNDSSLLFSNLNITLPSSERRKRLLPYQNFYFNQPFNRPHQAGVSAQQYKDFEEMRRPIKTSEIEPVSFRPVDNPYQPGQKFNPFRENNALPGSFRPMVNSNHPKPQYVVLENSPIPDEINKDVSSSSNHPSSDLSAIYEKLAQLKLRQQAMHYKAPYGYRLVPQHRFRDRPQNVQEPRPNYVPKYKIHPSKTTIETFTATNIDIPDANEELKYDYQEPPRYHQASTPSNDDDSPGIRTKFPENVKHYIHHQVVLEIPQSSVPVNLGPLPVRKPVNNPKERPRTYILLQQSKTGPKQQMFSKPNPTTIVDESYVAENFVPVAFPKPQHYQQRRPIFIPQQTTPPVYQNPYEVQYQGTPRPTEVYQQDYQHLDNSNYDDKINSQKANQLQPSLPESSQQHNNNGQSYYHYQSIGPSTSPPKAAYNPVRVPQKVPTHYQDQNRYQEGFAVTSTAPKLEDAKGNSLAELLKKLQDSNALPQTLTPDNIDNSIKTLVRILNALKEQKKQQKPAVVQEEYEYENEAGVDLGGDVIDSPEGGTPGKAGVDYPALSSIPKTSFSCKTQRYKGFFGDPDTNCQVWHYCDLNGGQASFLCPNGTIFSQVALTCDWWYNVKCASTAQLYVLNERLYKYIIPLSPKFPEDYSGPLVDKYLAMKFQEMEEKLKKQKKGKGNSESKETTESDEEDEDDDEEEESDSSKDESQVIHETENPTTNSSKTTEVATIINSTAN